MKFNPDIHHRRSIRLMEYDYTGGGAYYVTVCAHGRECLFGDVVDEVMRLNEFGEFVRECWNRIPEHFTDVILDEYVLMPNHFHGIVIIQQHRRGDACVAHGSNGNDDERARHASPLRSGPSPTSLGAIVGSFKSAVTKLINQICDNPGCPVWQRNYFERVIRNDRELAAIREYIINNPQQWVLDRENPANHNQA
ncbi:MAG TPA: transposase [Geobacteraceae bacterium]|nr:transposase [Geobacteraceae bacterium]